MLSTKKINKKVGNEIMKKEELLKMVKENGYALKHIEEQTKEICLEAVKENGYALGYVKEQTKEICIEAVKQNIDAIRYVKNEILKKLNIISY